MSQALTHFKPMFCFYARLKHQKTYGFLILSGGIEMEHWLKMDKQVYDEAQT